MGSVTMNRVLALLVLAETLVILILLLDRDERRGAAPRVPPDERAVAEAPSSADVAASMIEEPGRREREGFASQGTLVYGRLTGPGGEVPRSARVSITPEVGETVSAHLEAGHYTRPGLSPGRCLLMASARGFKSIRLDLEIPEGAETLRRDLRMERALEVAIFFITPDGQDLATALEALGKAGTGLVFWAGRGLSVTATKDSPPPRLAPTLLSAHLQYGVGEFRRNVLEPGEKDDGRSGTLAVRAELPVHLSVCLRSEVLRTVVLREPVDRLELSVDPRELARRASGVTFRLSCDGDQSRLAETDIELVDRQSAGFCRPERDGNRVTFRNAPPGALLLSVWNEEGLEQYARAVILPAGEMLDLGTIHLGPRRSVTGRVLGPGGARVPGARVNAADLERPWKEQWGCARSAMTDADGRFEMELGPHLYCLTAVTGEHAVGVAEADARSDDSVDVLIRLQAGSPVRILPERVSGPTRVRIEDMAGRLLVARTFREVRALDLLLAPGSYVLTVTEPSGTEHRRGFRVVSDADRPLVLRWD
jgi:hypothetical protein